MKYEKKVIHCNEDFPNTCRKSPFIAIIYTLNYVTDPQDKDLVEFLLNEAVRLSEHVNKGAANNSTKLRDKDIIFANCIAGVVSEYFWKLYLNRYGDFVESTDYVEASTQIDLIVKKGAWRIEVRSSFPRNGFEFAICHPKYQFDIIGPYSNAYKPNEIKKHFYVRTLFHMEKPTDIIDKIKHDGFQIVLAGGATRKMMFNTKYSKEKDFIPEDAIVEENTKYQVVPFSNALDTVQMRSLITGNI